MLRYLRIAVTLLSLAAGVCITVMWVQSYSGLERLGSHATTTHRYHAFSVDGQLILLRLERFYIGLEVAFELPKEWLNELGANPPALGLRYGHDGLYQFVLISYWLLAVSLGAIGGAAWIPWSSRFSLRTLFVAMALVAIGLAIVVAS